MSWNYRVIRTEHKPDRIRTATEVSYAIHEAYYDKKGDTIPTRWTAEPVTVVSDDRMGLLEVLAKMAEAIRQPTLEVSGNKLVEVEPKRTFTDELAKALKAIEIEAAS